MPDRERKRPAKASMPWRGVPWAGEKGNSPPHGHTMRERPGAPLWPKGRPCADGSAREESRKTRSPPSFRRGKTRPAALTQPMICVPTGKPVGATLAGSLTREVRMPPLPVPSLPQGHAFQPWGRRLRDRALCARAGTPLWDAGPDVVLSVILQDGDHPRPIRHMRPRRRAWRRPPGRRQGELHVA